MNVTENKNKDRQPPKEGYSQKVSAGQKEITRASACERITENNNINTTFQTDNLLEEILHRDNLNMAYKRVKSNKGAGGIDKMSVDELLPYLRENRESLIGQIREGKYKPNPVRRVEIPKEEKGKSAQIRHPQRKRWNN